MFNPFEKSLKEITENDLERLKSVAEGWYIEYKRERPKPNKIAKSIASFANSKGGLYFIGIEEDKNTNQAKSIVGVGDTPDSIRDSVRGYINPFPFFETYSIVLSNSKKVIMVVVPESYNVPHIHSDGRVYCRQGSASDPVPENDRYSF